MFEEPPLGVPTTCDGGPPHPCEEGDCVVCLCHIAKCETCWSESEEELRAEAKTTYVFLKVCGSTVIDHDGLGNPITLESV